MCLEDESLPWPYQRISPENDSRKMEGRRSASKLYQPPTTPAMSAPYVTSPDSAAGDRNDLVDDREGDFTA